jgi:hypothetical protein
MSKNDGFIRSEPLSRLASGGAAYPARNLARQNTIFGLVALSRARPPNFLFSLDLPAPPLRRLRPISYPISTASSGNGKSKTQFMGRPTETHYFQARQICEPCPPMYRSAQRKPGRRQQQECVFARSGMPSGRLWAKLSPRPASSKTVTIDAAWNLAYVVLYLKPHAPFFEVPIRSSSQSHGIPDVLCHRLSRQRRRPCGHEIDEAFAYDGNSQMATCSGSRTSPEMVKITLRK